MEETKQRIQQLNNEQYRELKDWLILEESPRRLIERDTKQRVELEIIQQLIDTGEVTISGTTYTTESSGEPGSESLE